MTKDHKPKCTICKKRYLLLDEGGIQGFLGDVFISICPTCIKLLKEMMKELGKN